MDPAMDDHGEAVNKLARNRKWPPRLACPADPKLPPRIQSGRCPQESPTVSGAVTGLRARPSRTTQRAAIPVQAVFHAVV